MLEGVVGIVEGMNPKLIRNKLEAYQRKTGKHPADDRARAGSGCGHRPEADERGIMARRKHPSHPNHERWLVSYADFITLLFAFFVVMFATAQTDNAKTRAVSESVKKALQGDSFKSTFAMLLGGKGEVKGQGVSKTRTQAARSSVSAITTGLTLAELLPILSQGACSQRSRAAAWPST